MSDDGSRMQSAFINNLVEGMRQGAEASHSDMKQARHNERVEFAKFLEAESVESVEKMIGHILNMDDLPEETRIMVESMMKPEHPVQLAALIPILFRLAWDFAGAFLSGPLSRVTTLSLRNFGDFKPDPQYSADAVAKNRIEYDLGQAWMKDNGYTEVDFGKMVDIARLTLSPNTALALWQQGKIDQGRFIEILQRTGFEGAAVEEWQRFRFTPPSVSDVMNAVTENQVTPEFAKQILSENGLDPANYEWLYETNGRSPGIDQLNRLKNYGLIDDALYEQGILESPIKNKYVEPLKNSRFRRPPMEQTLTMARRGIIDKTKTLEYLAFNGYFPDDAEALANYALAGKAEATKELSAANVRGMYAEGLFSRDEAASRLTTLGYDAEESKLMLDYADAVRKRQRTNMAVNRVRTQYVSRKITDAQAASALDQLQVASDIRNDLLADWKVEHETMVRHLSVSEIIKGARADLLTPQEVQSRLLAWGYTESDTGVLMELNGVELSGAEPLKDLTVAQTIKAAKKEVITRVDARARILAKGYEPEAVDILLNTELGAEQ